MEKSGRTQLGRREAIGLLGLSVGLAALRREVGAAALAPPAAAVARVQGGTIIRTVLKDVSPDYYAVRTSVCAAGKRDGVIDASRVKKWKDALV